MMNLRKRAVSDTFLKFLVPTVMSYLTLSVISLTDLVIAGHFIGATALSAISLAYPVVVYTQILFAFFGVGGAIHLSTQMGRGRWEECSRIFTTAIAATVLFSVLSAIPGLLFLDPLLKFLGASGGDVWIQARGYISVLTGGLPFLTLSPVMVMYLRNDSEQRYALLCVTVAGVTNLVLSLFLVIVADMGTMGIAIGSVFSEMLCCLLAAFRLFSGKRMFRLVRMKPDITVLRQILYPGMTLAVIFFSHMFQVVVVNRRLGLYGSGEGIAVYAVVKYLIIFMFAFFDGVNGSMQPMLGIYYGEREKENVKTTAGCGAAAMLLFSVAMLLLMALGAPFLCRLFSLTGEVTGREGIYAFRMMAFCCPMMAFITFVNGFYRCTENVVRAFWISLTDNFVFPVACVYVFSMLFGMRGVWYGLLAGSFCTCILIAILCLTGGRGLLMLEEKDFLRKEKEFLKIYPANRENLQEIVRDLEEYGKSAGLSTRQNYFINLIIEELVVNVIMMADSGRNRRFYVDVRVFQDEEGHLTVRVRDNLTQFDPAESGVGDLGTLLKDYRDQGQIREGAINELGIGMIKRIAREYSYHRTIGYNNFLVTI